MSALPVFIPNVSFTYPLGDQSRRDGPSAGIQPQARVRQRTVPANWQLTDRGIAVVMLVAGMIITIALAVIGLTVVRVTSSDYDPSLQESQQVHQ